MLIPMHLGLAGCTGLRCAHPHPTLPSSLSSFPARQLRHLCTSQLKNCRGAPQQQAASLSRRGTARGAAELPPRSAPTRRGTTLDISPRGLPRKTPSKLAVASRDGRREVFSLSKEFPFPQGSRSAPAGPGAGTSRGAALPGGAAQPAGFKQKALGLLVPLGFCPLIK